MLLNGGDRDDPVVRVFQVTAGFLRLYRSSLQHDYARDDLQAVNNTMFLLLQKDLLLPYQIILLVFEGSPFGYILDAQQYRRML